MNNPLQRINKVNISKTVSFFKRNGLEETYYKVAERLSNDLSERSYNSDLKKLRVSDDELLRQREETFTHAYKFSILVPAYETNPVYMAELIDSVVGQSYENWELIIADASESGVVRQVIEQYEEDRIKYLPLSKNEGIAANTNAALSCATGEYIGLLDHDDFLEKDALYEVMRVLEAGLYAEGNSFTNKIKVIYTDEDKCNHDASRFFDPHRKLDFNIDLLRTNNYICHFLVVRCELARSIGGFDPQYDGSQDYDFILRAVENIPVTAVYHIDKVLYHWRCHSKSTAENPDSKDYAFIAGKRAIEAHLRRKGIKAEVVMTKNKGFYRVKYLNSDLSVKCLSRNEWNQLDKDKLDQIEEDLIMILSDDIVPISEDFLAELSGFFSRYEVGCVGGKVFDNRFRLESAGFTCNENGEFVPDFAGLNGHFSGNFHRANLVRRVDGVSLDCMMLRRNAVEFSDAGATLKQGYITIFDPYAQFRRK